MLLDGQLVGSKSGMPLVLQQLHTLFWIAGAEIFSGPCSDGPINMLRTLNSLKVSSQDSLNCLS